MISGPRNRVSDRSSLAIQAPPKVADSQSTLTLTKVAQSDLEADRSRVSWRPHPFAKTRTLTLAVSAAFRAVDSRLFVFPYFLLWLSKAEGKEDGFSLDVQFFWHKIYEVSPSMTAGIGLPFT